MIGIDFITVSLATQRVRTMAHGENVLGFLSFQLDLFGFNLPLLDFSSAD